MLVISILFYFSLFIVTTTQFKSYFQCKILALIPNNCVRTQPLLFISQPKNIAPKLLSTSLISLLLQGN